MFFKNGKMGAGMLMLILFLMIMGTADAGIFAQELQEGKTVIYVAGNPDLYPIEYYDSDEAIYKGMLPDLFEDFSRKTEYEVVYTGKDGQDVRMEKSKNLQVDLVSGCTGAEDFPQALWEDHIIVLESQKEGVSEKYSILFTSVADENLKQSLSDYFAGITRPQWNGMLLQASEAKENGLPLRSAAAAGVLLTVTAAVIILTGKIRYIKKVRLIQKKLYEDPVTGLGNRMYLQGGTEGLLNDKNRILYVMILFRVNIEAMREQRGEKAVDVFLHHITKSLKQNTGSLDLSARVSEEEFALLKFSPSDQEMKKTISQMMEELREENMGSQTDCAFPFLATGGCYRLRREDSDQEIILSRARQACLYAGEKGIPWAECDERMLRTMEEEKNLRSQVETALDREEFELYLHFFVDASSCRIMGAEALSRWDHPDRGLLMPTKYIPFMEEDGRVCFLDYYMLKKVCNCLEEIHEREESDFFISCNFSRKTLAERDFAEKCIKVIEQFDFPQKALVLEMTEHVSVSDMTTVYENIMKMKAYGIRIALDDFGCGYACFSDLERYRFDGLKIDEALIRNLSAPGGESILKGVIDIGHSLEMTVLAEGVETEDQAKRLRKLRCDLIQGFYFYKPLPFGEAKRIYWNQIKRRKSKRQSLSFR